MKDLIERYDVISPDGFSFFRNVYEEGFQSNIDLEIQVHNLIKARYAHQGYYSSNRGRYSLAEAAKKCTVIKKQFYRKNTGEIEEFPSK